MENYFLVKATYTTNVGKEDKKVTESYLFETICYKDAEDQAIKMLKDNISGEFEVTDIKKVSYNDIFENPLDLNENIEKFWYECKVFYISFDENSGVEKKMTSKCLMEGVNIKDVNKRLNELFENSNGDNYRILSIVETPILGIFKISDLKENK